ncbi:MAG TPA: VOC family protein [Myxococcota bacterium]|nr:VOC family protein [Myxococcota bacterium]
MIRGINHINLSVSDIERSFDFYHRLVGLKPLCKWPRGAYFLAGDDWFCLNVADDRGVATRSDYTHYAFSCSVDDFPYVVARLTSARVRPFKENRSEGDSFYFKDPDGHQLELHVGDWRSRIAAKKVKPWPSAEFFI